MEKPDINKAIKERFQGGWRMSLLSFLRKSANADVMEIMQEADGLSAEDENGGCELNLLSFTVTRFVPFILTKSSLSHHKYFMFVSLFNIC